MSVAFAATRTTVAATTSSTQLLGYNDGREMAIIFNNSTANLFVALGATAQSGAADFTYKVAAGGTLEVPANYQGKIQGVWDAANGSASVTELTS